MKEITDTEAAWAAGFLEGDGCFYTHKRNLSAYVQARQSTIRSEILEKLKSLFGGSIRNSPNGNLLIWTLTGKERLENSIQRIYPFIISRYKRKGAKRILKYCAGGQRKNRDVTKKITEEQLRELYTYQVKSTIEIGKLLGCSQMTIWNKLKKFGIPIRTPIEASKIGFKKYRENLRKR